MNTTNETNTSNLPTTGYISTGNVSVSGIWGLGKIEKLEMIQEINFVPKQVYVSADGKTVVCVFEDGDERKATRVDNDVLDVKVGIALCIAKKVFGNNDRLNGFCNSKRVNYVPQKVVSKKKAIKKK